MNIKKGETHWIIPDGYIPPLSSGELTSHESICILNCNEEAANILITIYFEDRDPIEKIPVMVEGKRSNHLRTSTIERNGESIPPGVPYSIEVESDLPIFVQYSRLDSTQPGLALMSTMGYPIK
ncbi:sensory rhodopsin transducer [uncultured Metabacillus sp.]|uniref:sensory rhodopsin transducer n=1 Tax=Metabacillus sp. Hm71 TaxID=3450743 RepID=UPI00261C5F31|nr:sensory rhodopsin transducer [uncultured Metabacillus sp.]